MTTRTHLSLTVTLVAAMTASIVSAAPAPRPQIVAQIIETQGGGFGEIAIERDGSRFAATRYEPLYPGDHVLVARPGLSATMEFRGGETQTVTGPGGDFVVPSAKSGSWSAAALQRVLTLFPTIFAPPASSQGAESAPAPWRGPRLEADPLLPLEPQTLAASNRPVEIPVIWRGNKARVALQRANGSVLAQGVSDVDGRAMLYVTRLQPGPLVLMVSTNDEDEALRFAITVGAPAMEPRTPAVDQIAAALKGPKEARLQALIDLHRLAEDDYVAYALLRDIERRVDD